MSRADRTHRRLLVVVGVLAVATAAAIVLLWPPPADVPDEAATPTPLVDGVVRAASVFDSEPDPATGGDGRMVQLSVELVTGPDAGETVTIEAPAAGYPDFDLGDEVKLSPSLGPDGDTQYVVTDFDRLPSLAWLAALFVLAVLLVGGWRGLRALVGLGLSLMVITRFVVPAILAGASPFAVALAGSLAVMLITLYLAHGVNPKTTSAVVGTAAALAVTVGLGVLFIDVGELTGFASEEATFARFAVGQLDLRGLVLAGLIIAALGVLDDVTVAQASTVFALHDTDPRQSWGDVFTSAMRVGRDHIASTVNTLFLAYAGASIALLVLFATGGLPIAEIVNSEIVAEEVIKLLVGSIGLISAVPLTTALATTIAVRRPPPRQPVLAPSGRQHPPMPNAPADPADPADAAAGPLVDDTRRLDHGDRAYEAWVDWFREDASAAHDPPPDAGDEQAPRP